MESSLRVAMHPVTGDVVVQGVGKIDTVVKVHRSVTRNVAVAYFFKTYSGNCSPCCILHREPTYIHIIHGHMQKTFRTSGKYSLFMCYLDSFPVSQQAVAYSVSSAANPIYFSQLLLCTRRSVLLPLPECAR